MGRCGAYTNNPLVALTGKVHSLIIKYRAAPAQSPLEWEQKIKLVHLRQVNALTRFVRKHTTHSAQHNHPPRAGALYHQVNLNVA